MMRSKNNIIVAIALFVVKCAVANVVTNSFIIAQGNGVSVSQDGSIIHDKRANDDITVRARSGWLVNGRDSVSLSASRGGMLKVMSRLGEDEEHVHVYPSETNDVHSSDIILGVLPKRDNLIAMYALPDTSSVVSVSATCKVIEKGSHEETTTYYPCECGEIYDSQETDKTYNVTPKSYEWTASCANRTLSSSTWTGEISKGLAQSIEFTVTGKRDVCSSCTSTATTNVLVDVHELLVTNDLYLGLDRTDLGRTNPVVKTAIAKIDPTPTGSSAYSWTDCGICSFTGRTDQAEVKYFASNPDKASKSYLSESLTVQGTATSAEGLSVSANCTTNFTVVKVDVTIGGVDEEKEEKEGAFIPYVPDSDGAISEEGKAKMIPVTFSCLPTLPAGEMVTVTHSGEGELYEELANGELVLITATDYPACEIGSRVFKLHGHGDSSALRDGVVRIDHATSGAKDVAEYTSFSVQFITPAGDPVRAPKDVGDGQNEFTFSTANPGVLTMNLKARVTPAAAAPIMAADCHFEVGAVGTSAMAWAAANPSGKAIGNGGFLTAMVTFTGLPDKNDAFGKKKAILQMKGRKLDENDYEVFFPKNATNHPCTPSNSNWPNWMFYWLQTVEPLGSPAPDFVYGTSSYFTAGTKTITLSDGDAGSYDAPYGANNTLCGIDNFAWTVIHESQHYKDWLDLWSNNYTNWYMSHRGGVAPDDDKDEDNIPNRVEDVNLNKTYDFGDLYDWSVDNTPTAGRPPEIVDDFEDWNCQRHKNVKGDHSKDWGDPGMQHKTRDKYND